MKLINLAAILVMLSVSGHAWAEQSDYKCFVTASQGQKIVFFGWKPADVEKNQMRLVGKRLQDSKGNPNYIKKVHECVSLKEDFSDQLAQKLDTKTLR